ncbi:mechanosensitive ion channel MscS [Sulfuricella denitrificans skB26]|uniref:Small-conductance mechanosensitive channel n=1 Tax=Sulfuricella denitrificans (strain DSM 22764 / NBRC 105220 / skB26) TaxID=1163617 RepID=S6AHW9_SULDS|nr:mechanosensitive ion channel domain-containing protein [Sulfuricella denitrificans]BAN34124.1 mechanosensitive ion channel MscS [Sulfuricella denitrificans skB26]
MDSNDLNPLAGLATIFQLDRLLLLVVSIVLLALFVKTIKRFADKLYQEFPARRLAISQTITSLSFFIYIVGGTFLVYGILNPPKELMIAVGGSAAVAIGLSLKDLVSSVIAGFILLFDRPFQVGDRVSFGGVYGEIKSIGLRAVRLVTLDDNEVTIPNNRFMTDVVSSGNSGALDMMITANFHLALDADIQLARSLLREVLVTSRYAYLKKPVSIVVAEVEVAERLAVQLKAKAYVIDVRFEKAFQTDVYLRAIEAFERHGIKRPVLK